MESKAGVTSAIAGRTTPSTSPSHAKRANAITHVSFRESIRNGLQAIARTTFQQSFNVGNSSSRSIGMLQEARKWSFPSATLPTVHALPDGSFSHSKFHVPHLAPIDGSFALDHDEGGRSPASHTYSTPTNDRVVGRGGFKNTKRRQVEQESYDEDLDIMLFGRDAALQVSGYEALYEPWMIHPDSIFRRAWNLLTVGCVIVLLFWIPFDLGFNFDARMDGTNAQRMWFVIDVVMDVFFTLDILINFRTAVVEDGEVVQAPRAVAKLYLRGWFWIDLFATIPYDRIILPLYSAAGARDQAFARLPRFLRFLRLIRLMRLMRLMKLRRLLDHWEELGVFANTMWRVFRMLFSMVAVGHILGCAWYFVADLNGLGADTWAGAFNLQSSTVSLTDRYTVSVYWAFVTVTTVGYGDVVPVSSEERRVVIVCTFIGNLAFAYMIGKMTAMAARVDAAGQMYQAKMDEVNEFMRHHMLPKALRERVRSYYESFWSHGVYFNERRILGELSFALRRDVDFYLKREIISSVPFFQDADPNFVAELISRLELKHCQAGEALINIGEIGREMFIIKSGEVVVEDAEGNPSHHLGDGAFFGEICLLDTSLKRTASVRSVQACELYTLTKESLDVVLEHYPDFREAMSAIAAIRQLKSTESDDPVDAVGSKVRRYTYLTPEDTQLAMAGQYGGLAVLRESGEQSSDDEGAGDDDDHGGDDGAAALPSTAVLAVNIPAGVAKSQGSDGRSSGGGSGAPANEPNSNGDKRTLLQSNKSSPSLPGRLRSEPKLVPPPLANATHPQPHRGASSSTDMSHSPGPGKAGINASNGGSDVDLLAALADGGLTGSSTTRGAAGGAAGGAPGSVRVSMTTSARGGDAVGAGSTSSVHDETDERRARARARRKYLASLPQPAAAMMDKWYRRREERLGRAVAASSRGMGLAAPSQTAGTLVPTSFEQCTRLLAMKHRIGKRFMEAPVVTKYRRKRAAFARTVLGHGNRFPEPAHNVGVVSRLELLETSMMDMASKLDLLLASQGLRHPTCMDEGLWPQPAKFKRREWHTIKPELHRNSPSERKGGPAGKAQSSKPQTFVDRIVDLQRRRRNSLTKPGGGPPR